MKTVSAEVLIALISACCGGLLVGYNDRATFTTQLDLLKAKQDLVDKFMEKQIILNEQQTLQIKTLDDNQKRVMQTLKIPRE